MSTAKREPAGLDREVDARLAEALMDVAASLVLVLDRRGRVVRFNKACERATGWSFAEVEGQDFFECFLPPEHLETVRGLFDRMVASGAPTSGANPLRTRSGEPRLVSWSNACLCGDDGAVCFVIATGIDVTDAVEAEKELSARAAELQAVLDAVPAAVFIARDPEARQVDGNRVCVEMLHLPPGANVSLTPRGGQGAPGFWPIKDGRAIPPEEMPVQRAARGQPVSGVEFAAVLADGAVRHFLGNAATLTDGEGRPRGAVGAFVDITDRRKAEQERERLLSEVGDLAGRLVDLQAVTAAISSSVTTQEVAAVVTREGLRAVPGACLAMIGLFSDDRSAVLVESSRPQSAGRVPVELVDDAVLEAMCSEAPLYCPTSAEIAAGVPRALRAGRLPADLGGFAILPVTPPGTGAILFGFDAPRSFGQGERELLETLARLFSRALERARLYESEARLRAEAEQESRLRERMMAILGHDLRQPMTVVQTSLAALRRRESLSERGHSGVERMQRAVQNMESLIGALLDYSRVRGGKAIFSAPRPCDLEALCRRAVDDAQTGSHGPEIVFEAQGDLRGVWDPERIGQVLANLLANARRYGDPAEPVQLTASGRSDDVVLAVHNQGPPIPAEALPTIFEPFHQTRGEHSGSRGSLGLGLYIVREIVHAHRGRVEVDSAEGRGTRFVVTLPRRVGAD